VPRFFLRSTFCSNSTTVLSFSSSPFAESLSPIWGYVPPKILLSDPKISSPLSLPPGRRYTAAPVLRLMNPRLISGAWSDCHLSPIRFYLICSLEAHIPPYPSFSKIGCDFPERSITPLSRIWAFSTLLRCTGASQLHVDCSRRSFSSSATELTRVAHPTPPGSKH